MKSGWLKSLFLIFTIATVLVVVLEIVFRVAGYPRGTFNVLLTGVDGQLYPRNTTIPAYWGPIPYRINTNNLGLRGSENISIEKAPGLRRVITLGDSFTDGFFVDNQDTYPEQLQVLLRKRRHNVEVVNVAKGGASIDTELQRYRHLAKPLKADLVILGIYINDLPEMPTIYHDVGKLDNEAGPTNRFIALALTKSALVEFVFEHVLRWQSPQFMAAYNLIDKADRYVMPGGREHAKNVKEYKEAQWDREMLVLADPWDVTLEKSSGVYAQHFSQLVHEVREDGSKLLVIYIPSYVQVYDSVSYPKTYHFFNELCTKHGVTFLDTTNWLREHREPEPLYLVPADLHMNPAGYQQLALLLANYLEQNGYLAAEEGTH